MFDKFCKAVYARIFPCHHNLMKLFDENAESVNKQTIARERLQAVCHIKAHR